MSGVECERELAVIENGFEDFDDHAFEVVELDGGRATVKLIRICHGIVAVVDEIPSRLFVA